MSLFEGDDDLMAGDIWSSGAFAFESPLKELLDTGNFTLEQLLGEDELLQELRGVHPQIVEFLSREETMRGLVDYICMPPPLTNDTPHGNGGNQNLDHIRFPYMACEIICCEIDTILDALVGTDERGWPLLDALFSFLFSTDPGKLDDHRAGYLDKIVSVLLRKRSAVMMLYFNETLANDDGLLMKSLFSHLSSHSIMQVVLRLVLPTPLVDGEEEDDDEEQNAESTSLEIVQPEAHWYNEKAHSDCEQQGSSLCNWSKSEETVDLLLNSLVGPESLDAQSEQDEERRFSESQHACEILIAVIQNSPLSSPFMVRLTTDPILGKLINVTLGPQNGAVFSRHDSRQTFAMAVLESLVLQLGGYGAFSNEGEECKPRDPIETEQDESGTCANVEGLVRHLPKLLTSLSDLLRHTLAESWEAPAQYAPFTSQQLVGTSRLRIIRLVESLVLLRNRKVDEVLCQSDCLQLCLDMFWNFPWCNMLHQPVANLLVHVFEGSDERSDLQEYFLVRCDLLTRLMNSCNHEPAVDDNDALPSEMNKTEDTTFLTAGSSLSEAIMEMKDQESKEITSSVESEDGSDSGERDANDKSGINIPEATVVDSDVDHVAPRQESGMVQSSSPREEYFVEARDGFAYSGMKTHSQDLQTHCRPFRNGNLGHVVIICKALVHACESDSSPSHAVGENQEEANPQGNAGEGEKDSEGEPPRQDCLLLRIIQSQPVSEQWETFVKTTLASETTAQSFPLGGPGAPAESDDVLRLQRVSLNMNGLNGNDDGAGPGLLIEENGIDMDDNDLDVAASMMDAMSLRENGAESVFRDGAKESTAGAEMGSQTSGPRRYSYDDPLGGNTNRFEDENDDQPAPFDNPEGSDPGLPQPEEDDEVPVMDLFAGNFALDNQKTNGNAEQWSDFANFDDAFANSNTEGISRQDSKEESETVTNNSEDLFAESPVEDLFANTNHSKSADLFAESPVEDLSNVFGNNKRTLLLAEETPATDGP